MTPAVQEKIVTAMLAGNYLEAACGWAGIARNTGLEWMARGEGRDKGRGRNELYANFANEVRRAEAQAEVKTVAIIQKEIPENARLGLDFLARRHPDRWGPKERREISGPMGGPIPIREIVVSLSEEEDGTKGEKRGP